MVLGMALKMRGRQNRNPTLRVRGESVSAFSHSLLDAVVSLRLLCPLGATKIMAPPPFPAPDHLDMLGSAYAAIVLLLVANFTADAFSAPDRAHVADARAERLIRSF
jgi:hypothetical protein